MAAVDELKTAVSSDPSGDASKVSFTPEQQARVQSLIDEAYRRAFSKAAKGSGSTEVEALKEEVKMLNEEKKMASLMRAISKHNVVDVEEVAELLSRHAAVDDSGRVVVSGVSGSGGLDSAITLDEYVARWVGERPHHLRSNGSSGSGSQGARFGGKTNYNLGQPSIWRTMPKEDLTKLLKEGVDVHGSAGQTFKFKTVANPFLEARKERFARAGK